MMDQMPPDQNALFYDFCLEKHVPSDHLLRRIDALLDLSNLRQHLADFYSTTGRPSIDPELMVRMLLVGYCHGIRSERRLCEEVHLNLAYRWFCRLGLDGTVPDHSTFSKNRHGGFRDSDAFRYLFEDVVERAIAIGLVCGEGFAVDASLIKANANCERCIPGSELKTLDRETVSEVVQHCLDTLDVEGQAAPPWTATQLQGTAHRCHEGQHHHIPGQPVGLQRLSAESAVLSQRAIPQNCPQCPRRCA